jgi:transcriptional regulator with XRE-family HTH domain
MNHEGEKQLALARFGNDLKTAFKTAGLSTDDVVERTGVGRTSIYRWLTAENEAGWFDATQVILALGRTPTSLMAPGTQDEPPLEEADAADWRASLQLLLELKRQTAGVVRPFGVVERMLRRCVEEFNPARLAAIPPGTRIAAPESGVKTYEPPPARGAAGDSGRLGRVGEEPGPYPERKSSPQRRRGTERKRT